MVIAMLTGRLLRVREDYIILDVNGVGYKVYTPLTSGMITGAQLTLHTYLQVREDALVLFGFKQEEQLDMFELLITVSGMGPKSALGVLTHMDTGRLRQAVATEDVNALTKVPGVGKKTAQRLVLELRDKLKQTVDDAESLPVPENVEDISAEALEALTVLGYSTVEAKGALTKVLTANRDERDLETLIKLALKQLR